MKSQEGLCIIGVLSVTWGRGVSGQRVVLEMLESMVSRQVCGWRRQRSCNGARAGRHGEMRDGRSDGGLWECGRAQGSARMGCFPVGLQVLGEVLAGVLQLILVQNNVEHLGRTLSQFLSCHHLDVEVPCLGLATGLDESLEDLYEYEDREYIHGYKSRMRDIR